MTQRIIFPQNGVCLSHGNVTMLELETPYVEVKPFVKQFEVLELVDSLDKVVSRVRKTRIHVDKSPVRLILVILLETMTSLANEHLKALREHGSIAGPRYNLFTGIRHDTQNGVGVGLKVPIKVDIREELIAHLRTEPFQLY